MRKKLRSSRCEKSFIWDDDISKIEYDTISRTLRVPYYLPVLCFLYMESYPKHLSHIVQILG